MIWGNKEQWGVQDMHGRQFNKPSYKHLLTVSRAPVPPVMPEASESAAEANM